MSYEQNVLLELVRENADCREFLREQYPTWESNPQAAAEALEELKDFGAVT